MDYDRWGSDIGPIRVSTTKDIIEHKPRPGPAPRTKEVTKFFFVHSKDRDTSLYPSPSRYRIDNVDTLGAFNIKSISLHSAILPNCNSILEQPYLLLNIDELQGSFDATNSASQKALALLMLDKSYDTKFLNIRSDVCRVTPQKIGQSLKSLTISLTDQYGIPFDFGLDAGNSIDGSIQHTLVFSFIGTEVVSWRRYEDR